MSSHPLDKTGLWLALSWARLHCIDCKEKMCDFNMVPPIHSSQFVHSLTRKLQVWRIHLQPVQTIKSHVLSKLLLTLLAPLSLSPHGDVSGFAARRGGLSLCWSHVSHAAGNYYQLFPRNNLLCRSCLYHKLFQHDSPVLQNLLATYSAATLTEVLCTFL